MNGGVEGSSVFPLLDSCSSLAISGGRQCAGGLYDVKRYWTSESPSRALPKPAPARAAQ